MSSTKKILQFGDKKIILIGTAHVSSESVEEVKKEILDNSPDCIAVELDQKRYESMINKEKYQNLDIIEVLKRNEGFLLLANLILSSFQKRMGQNVGVKPGDEMAAAIELAKEKNIPFELVDREVSITLKRAWARNSFWGKNKLLASLIASAFDKEEVSSEQIEQLKNQNEMDSMMAELAEYLPTVKEVLIDERDRYLASHIWECKGNTVLAVLGAGHLPGVESYLQKLASGETSSDTSDINFVKKGISITKVLGWLIPLIIVALIAIGFFIGGKKQGFEMAFSWVLWNSILAGIGGIVALAHPVTILTAIVGAPLTSLCPLIGVGIICAIVQATVCKPKVCDIETVQEDVSSFKKWYKNKLLKTLFVFLSTSIGSVIGTYVAGADIVMIFNKLFH